MRFATRLRRIRALLDRRQAAERDDEAFCWYPCAEQRVAVLRVIWSRLHGGAVPDPFPDLDGEPYLEAFIPWFGEHAAAWPRWAQATALRLLFSPGPDGQAPRWVRSPSDRRGRIMGGSLP